MKRGVLLLALLLLAPFASAFGAPVEQDVGRTITAWDVATETGVTVTGDVGGNLLLFAPGEAEPESEQLDENHIVDVVISADGERFVAISGKFLTLYGRTGGALSHHDFAGEIPLAAAISPSGDYYAAAYDSGNVRLWWFLNKDDVRLKWEFPDSEFDYSDEQRDEVRRGLNATSLLEMSSDYIAVAGKGKLYVMLRNGGSLKQAYPLDSAAQQLEISDDGGTLCLATQGSLSTYLFSGGSERSWRFESPEQDSVHTIGLAPDGGLLAVLHGSSSQVVTGFTPDSSEPAWEFELEASLIGPALAVSDSRVAVAGWGLGEPDLLLLSAGGKLLASTVSDAGASSVQFGGGRVVTNSGDALANYALPVAGGDSGGFELPADARTLGLAVAALLLLAGAVGAVFYLDIDLPFGGGGLPPPPVAPPSGGAPLKVRPVGAAGTVTIACPGCGARMKVPKLGGAQKVKCGECGLAGTAEI